MAVAVEAQPVAERVVDLAFGDEPALLARAVRAFRQTSAPFAVERCFENESRFYASVIRLLHFAILHWDLPLCGQCFVVVYLVKSLDWCLVTVRLVVANSTD